MRARKRRTSPTAVLAGLGICLLAPIASANVLLDSLRGEEGEQAWILRIQLTSPVRYLRHSPPERGRVVEIAIEPLAVAPGTEVPFIDGEALQLPSSSPLPLEDVRVEAASGAPLLLLVSFEREVDFEIQPGSDSRSIELRIAKAGDRGRAAGKSSAKTAAIMEEARGAMVAKDYERAISLYSLVLQTAAVGDPAAAEALEYLGLARQYNGQAAHARAEYEAYLRRFPVGEGAERVRQRLMALDTATAGAPDPMRTAETPSQTRYDFYGSLYTSYFRTQSFADLSGAELEDSSQLMDADLGFRLQRNGLELGARAAGYLRYDYDAGEVELPSRVTRLFVEARDYDRRFGGILGRQRSRGAGVLGRFDGLWGDWEFLQGWTAKAVAGFPIGSSVSNRVNTDEQVYGLSVESDGLVEGLDAELYGVAQVVDGLTDRAALGTEVRYSNEQVSAFSVVDFDVYHVDLNLATLSGAWRVTDTTTLNGVIDYRYSPFLTSRNALRGQPADDLDELQDLFSNSEIRDLARDRTPRVATIVAGASHRFMKNLEVNGDFTATHMGKTSGSGGVAPTEASDWEFIYFAQLIGWDWLVDGGSERLGFRFFQGWRYNEVSLRASGRYVAWRDLRFTPALRFDYRLNDDTQDFIELEPGLRFEYRFYGFVFDTDFVFQWLQGVGDTRGASRRHEVGYVLNVGLRYDF